MDDERYHLGIPSENVSNERFEPTGGGESVNRPNHKEHGINLKQQSNTLFSNELRRKDAEYTSDVFLKLETPENYSLKNQRSKIEELGIEVISYSKENKSIGTARIKKGKIDSFNERLDEYINSETNTGKTYFSPIERISSIPTESKINPEIDFENEGPIDIVINLFNVLEPKERLAINGSILEEVKRFSQNVDSHTFSNGITSIVCSLRPSQIAEIVADFSTIKEVKPNHTFLVESAMPAEYLPNPIRVKKPISSSNIAIFDSGIKNDSGVFNGLVSAVFMDFLPPGSISPHFEHGTFVASRCLFGDNVDDCIRTHVLNPYCQVIDIPIIGKDVNGKRLDPQEYLLRKAIEKIVTDFSGRIRVVNLSLGSPKSIKDFEFSELAKLIDFLAREHKILFVIAAGNINSLLGQFPDGHFGHLNARIGIPAESLLAITVGSIAKYTHPNALSEVDFISPFTRIGPGADLGVKPEIVAHGGNLLNPYDPSHRTSTYGISATGPMLAVDIGTSYAAPLVSQLAQKLFDLYSESDPNLVKALLCHFTQSREIHEELTEPPIKFVGFGEPIINKCLLAGPNNCGYLYEGKLHQEHYQYISFHVPGTMAESNANTRLKIRVTIAYDPPVNPDNELEYSKSRIAAKLIKPIKGGVREINVTGEESYNLPWNPLIRFEKTFLRSYECGEWQLRLRLYQRGLDEDFEQDFAVVIEVIDTCEGTDVYKDVQTEFANVYKQVEINRAA